MNLNQGQIDPALTGAAVAGAAASLSALFAAIYVWLTYRLVRSQTDPQVVVYVKHDESRPTILMIVVENVGRGLATEVAFNPSRPIPAEAWGIEPGTEQASKTMTYGPLINGIPTLGPGDTRKVTWGQFGGLQKALGKVPLELTCNFKRGKRKMQPTRSMLEVNSFEGTDASSSETVRLIKEVGNISKELANLSRRLDKRS